MESLNNPQNNNQNGRQQQIAVTPEDLTIVVCECGSPNFYQPAKIGRLSKVHPKNITGKTQLVSLPANYVCMDCGEELDPKKLAE